MNSKAHRQSLVIIGNGMAAGRLLDELLARDARHFDITVVGDEPQGSYNRIMLSSLLAREARAGDLIQKPPPWYRRHGIQWINSRATRIDRRRKRVSCGNIEILYDHLVIATGSRPSPIAAANQDLDGIFHFRGIGDVEAIEARAVHARRAVVVGGGLLGLEAAWGLARQGIEVTVVHRKAWLLNRQLDSTAGELLREALAEHGIRFKLQCEVRCFHAGDDGDKVAGVTLSDGQTLRAGIAVIATSITPNAELGFEAGLEGGKAIQVDDFMRTSDSAISALGECVEHEGQTFGLVDPIWEQCVALASRLAGTEASRPFRRTAHSTRLKVSGIQLFSMGELRQGEGVRAVELLDARNRIYRKLLLRGDRLCGAVLFGDVRGGLDYLRMMREQQPCASGIPRLLLTGATDDLPDGIQHAPAARQAGHPG